VRLQPERLPDLAVTGAVSSFSRGDGEATVPVRILVANPEATLRPGDAVRVTIP
jgi:hypothetical protein